MDFVGLSSINEARAVVIALLNEHRAKYYDHGIPYYLPRDILTVISLSMWSRVYSLHKSNSYNSLLIKERSDYILYIG